MIDRTRRAAALAVLLAAHRRYGTRSFRVDVAGPNYQPLVDAESLGWAWFVTPLRCAVTHAGRAELEPRIAEQERPVVEYLCPVCRSVVPQHDRGDGLPENVGCPTCARDLATATKSFETEVQP